jgi:hypothetical protein
MGEEVELWYGWKIVHCFWTKDIAGAKGLQVMQLATRCQRDEVGSSVYIYDLAGQEKKRETRLREPGEILQFVVKELHTSRSLLHLDLNRSSWRTIDFGLVLCKCFPSWTLE